METRGIGPSGETIDTPRHRALSSASRVAILRLVRAADAGLTATDVAERTGLHFSTVRAHLERLVDAGLLIKARASDGGPGRPPWRYRAASPEPAPAPYRTLAAALLDHLATAGGGTSAAVQAGQEWGRRLATSPERPADPVDAAVAVLGELGFDPHVRTPGADKTEQPHHAETSDDAGKVGNATDPERGEVEVQLRTCPFLELVGQQPDVMCALHAGVIRGVLRTAGTPDAEAVLEPFAAPNACVVRLRLPSNSDRQP